MEEKSRATIEQQKILDSKAKRLVISASAGSGKTYILIEKLKDLICNAGVKVERLLVLTFTKVAAQEMKTRLTNAILSMKPSPQLIESLDALPLSDISTIDSFCEKVIKRNINKLEIDENFTILDEKNSLKLKNIAFSNTYQHFAREKQDLFEGIYLAFKKNKSALQECIFAIQDFCSSTDDEEGRLDYFENHLEEIDFLSQERLKGFIKDCQDASQSLLQKSSSCDLTASEEKFVQELGVIIALPLEGDIFDICQRINLCKVPSLKGRHKEEVKNILLAARDQLKPVLELAKKYQYLPKDAAEQARSGALVKAIFQYYHYYIDLYSLLKLKKSGLDFADIEKFAKRLLCDDEVKRSLQEKYDYIFIDEYQDTNRLQEGILKPIAEGGYFTAVGDIKQGIYGFRNASMEIMQNDIDTFSEMEDGEALYLNGNFRTDGSILEFVNIIFEKIMTAKTVGIEYKENSMLKGLKKFLKGDLPPVCVDIILEEKKAEKQELGQELSFNQELSGNGGQNFNQESDVEGKDFRQEDDEIYSVKEDRLESDNSQKVEVEAIISKIQAVIGSNIYDAKLERHRKAEFGDIAILFRGRSKLMQELVIRLRDLGVPVNADLKESLIEDSQIALLNALLKLTLNFRDDISLACVMCSPFGDFSIDEIAQIRYEGDLHDNFFNIILNSENEKIIAFKNMVEQFKFDIQIFGVTKALCRLFNRYDFYDYLDSLDAGKQKTININNLFKFIKGAKLDHNVPGIISLLESSSDVGGGEGGSNAITITTIHATKGLEYPVVILCGSGESLDKAYNKSFILSDKFGLGCSLFDFESMTRVPAPSFLAGKKELERREFVDEIMIFYVALTRAQNHLFIIGKAKEKDFSFIDEKEQNSYLKFILFAFGENFASQLFSQRKIKTESFEFNILDSESEIKEIANSSVVLNNFKSNKFKEQIESYLDFEYENFQQCNLSFKNSVTGVLHHMQEELFEEDNIAQQQKTGAEVEMPNYQNREEAILTGNAYHEALKLVDFYKIENEEDVDIDFLSTNMTEGYFERIDLTLLYKNISILKEVVKDSALFKEKEFIMKMSVNEIEQLLNEQLKKEPDNSGGGMGKGNFDCGLSDLTNEKLCGENRTPLKEESLSMAEQGYENELIVQGIVDLFAAGEKIILVDYKYTSCRDENVIKNRYATQLKLYRLAIEKAFNRSVEGCFILSLKEGKLIKVD